MQVKHMDKVIKKLFKKKKKVTIRNRSLEDDIAV